MRLHVIPRLTLVRPPTLLVIRRQFGEVSDERADVSLHLVLPARDGKGSAPIPPTVTSAPSRIGTLKTPSREQQIVAAAVAATTSTGSFYVVHSMTEIPGDPAKHPRCPVPAPYRGPSSNQPIPVGPAPAGGDGCGGFPSNVVVTGTATVNVNPLVMRIGARVSNLGDVTLFVNGTTVWEFGGAYYGAAGVGAAPGAAFSQFAGLVEGTLGPREGALAMMGMASPNGYLTITKDAIGNATSAGTGTVDGVAVTKYRVELDASRFASPPGITPDESSAIQAVMTLLDHEGYTGTTEDMSVDGVGLIREIRSVAHFDDGGSVTRDLVYSQFGCAGVVVLPQSSTPPGPPNSTCPAAATHRP